MIRCEFETEIAIVGRGPFSMPTFQEKIPLAPIEVLKAAFMEKRFGLDETDAEKMANLIVDFEKDDKISIYDKMPKDMQKYINRICMTILSRFGRRQQVSRELVAKQFLKEFTSDVSYNAAISSLVGEMEQDIIETDREVRQLYNGAFQDAFNDIEHLRAEGNNELADRIQSVKDAFELAESFEDVMTYLKNDTRRNVKRYHQHYNSEITTFNNRSGYKNAKVPAIDNMYAILRRNLPKKYDTDDIKGFIVLLARSTYNRDLDTLANIAYVYKLVDSINKYFIQKKEISEQTFNKVCKIIDEMIKIKNTKPEKKK